VKDKQSGVGAHVPNPRDYNPTLHPSREVAVVPINMPLAGVPMGDRNPRGTLPIPGLCKGEGDKSPS